MGTRRQIVRKKAILALYNLYRRSPKVLERVEPLLKASLVDKDSSVVFAGLSVWREIINVRFAFNSHYCDEC